MGVLGGSVVRKEVVVVRGIFIIEGFLSRDKEIRKFKFWGGSLGGRRCWDRGYRRFSMVF